MGLFGKLFNKDKQGLKLSSSDVEQMVVPQLKSMLEIAFEYCGFNEEEVENIYVFNSAEEGEYFTFSYRIKGKVVERHLINELLDKKVDVSPDRQTEADEIGLENLHEIMKTFEQRKLDIPTVITIEYSIANQDFKADFGYEQKLIGTDLLPEDIEEQWRNQL